MVGPSNVYLVTPLTCFAFIKLRRSFIGSPDFLYTSKYRLTLKIIFYYIVHFKRWSWDEVVKKDMKNRGLYINDAQNKDKWRPCYKRVVDFS